MKRDEILFFLRDYFQKREDIEFAYLFGSMARGDANQLSDVDIGVMCSRGCSLLELMSESSNLLQIEDIDMVPLHKTQNLRLIKDIIKDAPKRLEWELSRYHLALDFLTHVRVVYGY